MQTNSIVRYNIMGTTIKDIAAAMHVSPATVSLALNGKPGVSDAVRSRIIQAASDMQYSPRQEKTTANKLTVRYVISVIEGSVVNSISFHSLVLKGIEKKAQELGYDVLISYLYDNNMLNEQLQELQKDVNGLLVLGTEFSEESPLCEALCHINQSVCPVVILDNQLTHSPLDCISNDNFYGAYQAISYLLEKGHRHIGYFSSSDYISNFGARADGVKAAVARARTLYPDVTLTRIATRFSTRNAYTDIQKWISSTDRSHIPTAYFADSDIIAFGALQAFSASGYHTPEDISIIGFDDMPECSMIMPPLTTIHVAKEKMGIEGMRLMNRRIKERGSSPLNDPTNHPPLRITISNGVKERRSVLTLP